MSDTLRLALAQTNLTVGAINHNTERVIALATEAQTHLQAQVIIFPELTLTSYPPEDLLLRPELHRQIESALEKIAASVRGIDIILGYPRKQGTVLYNAAGVISNGRLLGEYHKQQLPNYSVFDEKRYFTAGTKALVVPLGGIPTSINICEDIWIPGTATQAKNAGARLIININASPYHRGKARQREQILVNAVSEAGLPIVYVNLVGGQDELVFDGGSLVLNEQGKVCQRGAEFREDLYPLALRYEAGHVEFLTDSDRVLPVPDADASVYQALVLGVQDYVRKNGFKGAVLGLSGGIDSALTLAIAVDALGSENVEALLMPSRYTASMSVDDAVAECQSLAVRYHIIPIEGAVNAFGVALQDAFAGLPQDTTEENVQARCRGVLLMALSNKTGKLLLTTGNKSEMAVGYATLYGDMAGGFAPLKDVPKMLVYRLSLWRNKNSTVIPQRVIDRPPSAELRADQKDEDSLPPYPVLDAILEQYIEQDATPQQIIATGLDPEMVKKVIAMVDRNEYKRRQAAPGVKISARAFGRDRRYPITSGYRE